MEIFKILIMIAVVIIIFLYYPEDADKRESKLSEDEWVILDHYITHMDEGMWAWFLWNQYRPDEEEDDDEEDYEDEDDDYVEDGEEDNDEYYDDEYYQPPLDDDGYPTGGEDDYIEPDYTDWQKYIND